MKWNSLSTLPYGITRLSVGFYRANFMHVPYPAHLSRSFSSARARFVVMCLMNSKIFFKASVDPHVVRCEHIRASTWKSNTRTCAHIRCFGAFCRVLSLSLTFSGHTYDCTYILGCDPPGLQNIVYSSELPWASNYWSSVCCRNTKPIRSTWRLAHRQRHIRD